MKGIFKPKNPQKYKGNPDQIIFRSSWEFKLMQYCDDHDEIIEWSSEEFFIPYICPTDSRYHKYYPDFKIKTKDGRTLVIEVKPEHQTKKPTNINKTKRSLLKEGLTFAKNIAKWKAAENYCKDRGWEFKTMTEKHLGIK